MKIGLYLLTEGDWLIEVSGDKYSIEFFGHIIDSVDKVAKFGHK